MLSNIPKAAFGLCTVLALSACASSLEVTAPEVQASYLAGFDQNRVARSRVATVRSFTGRDRARAEFAGAQCQMISGEVTAQFVTPAKIILPAFVQNRHLENRGRPTGLRISCTANGR